MTDRPRFPAPQPSTEDLRRRLASELAMPSRLGHTALLLAGLAAAAVAGSLVATEPALPAATQLAFGVMTLIGLAWAAFAAWVLARRRVLFAAHRVIAARMAVAFTALFSAGSLAVWVAGGRQAAGALGAAATGAVMLAAAVLVLSHARRRVRQITARKEAIERQLREAR